MFRNDTITTTILVLAALALAFAAPAAAEEDKPIRHGFFVGGDIGFGAAATTHEIGGTEYDIEHDDVGAGISLRGGYQFTTWFGLSLDCRGVSMGFEDGHRTSVNSSALVATFYPGNNGFFLRLGFGGARVDVDIPDDYDTSTGLAREYEKDVDIGVFGLGYEWMMNDHYSLGIGLETRGGELDDFDDLKKVTVGEATFGVSMNYFF